MFRESDYMHEMKSYKHFSMGQGGLPIENHCKYVGENVYNVVFIPICPGKLGGITN